MNTENRLSMRHFFVIGLGLYILLYVSRSAYSAWGKRDYIKQREAVRSEMKAENEALKQQYAETQTYEFVEREARNKLGLVKEGDIVIMLNTIATDSMETTIETVSESTLRKWWKLFF